MKLDISVRRYGDLILGDGEILARGTGDAWTGRSRQLSFDNLGGKCSFAERITLAEAVGALETGEREAVERGETAGRNITPAVALLFLTAAFVVVICRCVICWSASPASRKLVETVSCVYIRL
jgi:hypothetical protein